MKYHVYWLLKSPWSLLVLNFLGMGNTIFFLRQKVDEKMIITNHWKVLVLNFLVMRKTVFFETKSWWKGDIYWLLKSSCFGQPKSSCFEPVGGGKCGLFFIQKVDVKIIFTGSFLAFHDIPGPGKYSFSCSDRA